MYILDAPSAFAICGAGSLVSSALMRPSLAHEPAGTEALRICRQAFAVIGIGLVQLLLASEPLPLWSQAMMALGSVAGVAMIGWALAALGGDRQPEPAMWIAVAIAAAVLVGLLPLGTPGMTAYITIGLAVASSVVMGLGRRVVLRPRDLNERLLGAMVLVMLLSSWLRCAYLVSWEGPFDPHLLHIPPQMVAAYALMYGVLPTVFTMVLVNVIGARLTALLHTRAMTDHLTGALSRHALADGAARLDHDRRKSATLLAVVMVDLDHFKLVNDRHGHAGGDAVLRHAAQVLKAQLRAGALLARYGGEEFVALLPVESLPVARRVAERMREAIKDTDWNAVVPGLTTVTASFGVVVFDADESLEHALGRADEALYRAKHNGRNQVQVGLTAA